MDRVRIGVVDLVFPPHPDLEAFRFEPQRGIIQHSFLTTVVGRSHGTAVAGIVAATGNNDQGVAGMVWGANLSLLAFGRGDSIVQDPVYRFEEMVDFADAAGVRVLVASAHTGDPEDTVAVRRMREALDEFLSFSRFRLLVLSAGHLSIRDSIQRLATGTVPIQLGASRRAAAQLIATHPGRILFVAGADSVAGLWDSTNVWTGVTPIAAPSQNITSLASPADGGILEWQGTSFSAPFVAGVAAQLIAMDPTLTGDEVTDYLRRGARDSLSRGNLRRPQPLAVVAPDTIYQLDAYGSLALLSRERPSTPICGFPVSVDANAIRLHRDSVSRLILAGVDAVGAPSVAQGGRRIAVTAFGGTAGAGRVMVLDHRGTLLATLPPEIVERHYLERDTLDVSFQLLAGRCNDAVGRTILTRRGPSGPATLEPATRLGPGAVELTGFTVVPVKVTAASPTGDRVAVAGTYGLGPNCTDTIQYRLDVMPFDAAAPLATVA
ncbi:MAG: S8 family peptidase, partial [Acidimicrobiales bacterium]